MNSITRRPREKICLCTCTGCRTYNLATRVLSGAGAWVSRSTRDGHIQDDKKRAPLRRLRVLETHVSQKKRILFSDSSRAKFQFLLEEMNWLRDAPIVSLSKPLVFRNNVNDKEFKWPSEDEVIIFNSGIYSLDARRLANNTFLHVEHRLCSIYLYLQPRRGAIEAEALADMALEGLYRITRTKKNEWDQQRAKALLTNKRIFNNDVFFLRQGPRDSTVRAACLTSLVLENHYFVSRRAVRTHLGGLNDILRQSGASALSLLTLPKDPRNFAAHFNLDPVTEKFLSCPRCHKLYPHTPDNLMNPAPLICLHTRVENGAICGESLWKERRIASDGVRHVPVQTYEHQGLKPWLGRFLARRDMEDLVESRPHGLAPEVVDDIWNSSTFSDLKDYEGKPFYPGPQGETRLVFSLSVDGFDPFGAKIAKQSTSSTGIWMVLLNLPWYLRYLPENVYLAGIIQGKPSKDELNHYIQLIVDELLEFWHTGVTYSQTYKYKLGRLVRAMLGPLVCDMLAARQVIGLANAPTSHYFCMLCDLDIDDIDTLDRAEWPVKRFQDVQFFARQWKDAKSETHRESIFSAFGWRWSPLFDLPYWNPLVFTVVESMHVLYLNLLQNHCRVLFRIDLDSSGGDGSPGQAPAKNLIIQDKTKVTPCLNLVRKNDTSLLYQLLELHRKILYTFCILYNIKREGNRLVLGSRWVLAQNIHAWRQDLEDTQVLDNLPDFGDDPESHEEIIQDDDSEVKNLASSHSQDEDDPMSDSKSDPDSDAGGNEELDANLEDSASLERVEQEIKTSEIMLDGLPDKLRLAAMRVIKHLTATDDRLARRRRAFGQSTIKIYHAIMKELDVPIPDKASKSDLHNNLLLLIDKDPNYQETLVTLVSSQEHAEIGAILGKDVMAKVWLDMSRTQFPTWITPAPPNWGTTKRGKLSADNWGVICTVHLPVTLIWMWKHETGRKSELLQNFMDLVSAVRVANMRVSSPSQIAMYESLIHRYLTGIKELFPHEDLKPSHHAALHIGDVLGRFGPNHSHGAHYYERYIAHLHKMNTNRQIGKLESTLLHTSARHANLCALLSSHNRVRETVEQMLETIKSIQSEDIRGYQLANVVNSSVPEAMLGREVRPFTLDHEYFQFFSQLQQSQGRLNVRNDFVGLKRVSFQGVSYGTYGSTHFRDSAVMFQPIPGGGQEAGIIETIFSCGPGIQDSIPVMTDFYAIVRGYPRVQRDDFVDPYPQYGFAGGYLCEVETKDVHIIDFSQILSHFALTRFPEENLIHVMPLDMTTSDFEKDAFGMA